ncbi:hypothetical protein IT881_08865 [Erythrobacter sp. A30-3]|nr:hypothetical protein IT881_08865 [Erythrobacter sp. A30-3]
MVNWEFVAEQFQEHADTDPVHWNSDEGCIYFGEVPVFYQRQNDCLILEAHGEVVELPR